MLVYWLTFYDNVFEHPERPDQKTIENDDLLDRWIEQKGKESEERARKNMKGSRTNSMSAYDHDDVIMFDDDEFEEYLEDEEYYGEE